MKKTDEYPMHLSPRCTAMSKRSRLPCKAPAVRGWRVCRMHGARGGSKAGIEANAYKHGGRTGTANEIKKNIDKLINEAMEGCRKT